MEQRSFQEVSAFVQNGKPFTGHQGRFGYAIQKVMKKMKAFDDFIQDSSLAFNEEQERINKQYAEIDDSTKEFKKRTIKIVKTTDKEGVVTETPETEYIYTEENNKKRIEALKDIFKERNANFDSKMFEVEVYYVRSATDIPIDLTAAQLSSLEGFVIDPEHIEEYLTLQEAKK